MNGYELAGRLLRVNYDDGKRNKNEDENGNGDNNNNQSDNQKENINSNENTVQQPVKMNLSKCIILKNMFDPKAYVLFPL